MFIRRMIFMSMILGGFLHAVEQAQAQAFNPDELIQRVSRYVIPGDQILTDEEESQLKRVLSDPRYKGKAAGILEINHKNIQRHSFTVDEFQYIWGVMENPTCEQDLYFQLEPGMRNLWERFDGACYFFRSEERFDEVQLVKAWQAQCKHFNMKEADQC